MLPSGARSGCPQFLYQIVTITRSGVSSRVAASPRRRSDRRAASWPRGRNPGDDRWQERGTHHWGFGPLGLRGPSGGPPGALQPEPDSSPRRQLERHTVTNRMTGRHRAPSRLTAAGTTITRSAKTTAVVATSGGLLAAAVAPASASPQGIVDEVASVVTDKMTSDSFRNAEQASLGAIDLLGTTMPVMAEPTDLPAVAAAAPKEVDTNFGDLGFTGVTPVVEEPEPVAEEPAAEAAPATTSSTSERTQTASSRTN